MENKKTNIPIRRFKEFENANAWEQCGFENLFAPVRNNSLSRAELNYESGAVKNIHYGDILVRFDSVVSYENEMIPYVNDSVEIDFSSHLLQDGDIIFADAAEDETVGKAVEITGIKDNKIVAGLHTIACRPTKKVEPLYLGYYLNSNAYHDQLSPIMQGTKVNSISRNSIAKTEILLPESADEQKAIGSFFSTLDHTITFHQRKLEKVKALKTAYLAEMFPAEGERKPKRRFAGFTDAWEQRRLGEFVEITTGRLDANAMVEDGEFDFYTSGIKKYKIDVHAFEGPAITIAGNGATVGYMHLTDGKFNAYQRTYVLSNFQADRQFMFSAIGKNLPKKISEEARTGNIPYIVMDMLTGLKMDISSDKEEQQKLGSFFRNVDYLITFHQRKLEKLQNIKSAYLNEMFV